MFVILGMRPPPPTNDIIRTYTAENKLPILRCNWNNIIHFFLNKIKSLLSKYNQIVSNMPLESLDLFYFILINFGNTEYMIFWACDTHPPPPPTPVTDK